MTTDNIEFSHLKITLKFYLFYLQMSIFTTGTSATATATATTTATATATEPRYIYTTQQIANLVCLCLF